MTALAERPDSDRLATSCRNWQAWSADAHKEATRCMNRGLLKMAIDFQNSAADFSRAARDRLFVLIDAKGKD